MTDIPPAFEEAFPTEDPSDVELDKLIAYLERLRERPANKRPPFLVISNISMECPVLIDSGLTYAEKVALLETMKGLLVSQQIHEWEQAGR